MKQTTRVKITGTASTTPRVSSSMSKAQPRTVAKSKAGTKSMVKKAGKK